MRAGVEGTLNLTLESMHHPSHIGPPPSPLACILIPLFAMPLLIHIHTKRPFQTSYSFLLLKSPIQLSMHMEIIKTFSKKDTASVETFSSELKRIGFSQRVSCSTFFQYNFENEYTKHYWGVCISRSSTSGAMISANQRVITTERDVKQLSYHNTSSSKCQRLCDKLLHSIQLISLFPTPRWNLLMSRCCETRIEIKFQIRANRLRDYERFEFTQLQNADKITN